MKLTFVFKNRLDGESGIELEWNLPHVPQKGDEVHLGTFVKEDGSNVIFAEFETNYTSFCALS